jgi:VanZ family protein
LKETKTSHRLDRLLFLGYLAFLVYASLYPITSLRFPEESPWSLILGRRTLSRSDALTNVLVYLPLGFFLGRLSPGRTSWRATLAGTVLSLLIEYLQAFVPGRVPSVIDWGLNVAGTFLGAQLAAHLGRVPWHAVESVLVAGARARVGLAAVGTWAASQLFPFVPSVDVDNLKEGLRPIWYVLRGLDPFSISQALVYALATLSLSFILARCLRPERLPRIAVPLFFLAVLLAKVPIVTRQLGLEALVGAAVGLGLSRRLDDSEGTDVVPFVAVLGALVAEALRSEDHGSLYPMNWIPFRTHLTNELTGAADILAGAWPCLALAFLVQGWSIDARRAALAGAVLVFGGAIALEWAQQFVPGRTPDVTDALIALAAWTLPWLASGSATGQSKG